MTTLTTAPTTSLSASLIAVLGAADPEPALEQAFIQLSRGSDLSMLLAIIKALVRVGLAGLAARLMRAMGGLLAANPQLSELADHLDGLPSGELPRELLQARLATRHAALVKVHRHLLAIPTDLDSVIHVYRSAKGNLHAVRDVPGSRLDLVFPFVDHAAHAQSIRIPPASLSTSFCLNGVPSPQLFERLLMQRTVWGFVPPIDIVEPDSDVFAAWLAVLSDSASLESPRVSCFVGPEAHENYRVFLCGHSWRTPATHTLTNHRPGVSQWAIDKAFCASINAAIEQNRHRERQRMRERYANLDIAHWSRRFAAAGTASLALRIAGFTTRYSTVIQHAMSDLAAAFRRRGCVFDLIKQPSEHCPVVDVAGALNQFDYDAVVVIDHLRFEFGEGMPAGIPYVCWVQDHMDQLATKQAGDSIGPLDLVICHSPHVMAALHGYPLGRCIGSNNLTDAATFSNRMLPESELRLHQCDVSFASHGSETPEQLMDEIAQDAPATFRGLLETFLRRVRAEMDRVGWVNSQDLVRHMLEAERESVHPPLPPDVRRTRIYPQLARVYDRVFRHQAIQWTASWATSRGRRFRLYGQGWENHATFAPFAAGCAANGREMRAVYQASSISLQVNGYSSLHQRLLDGLACGSFMLCRRNPADFIRRPFMAIQESILANGFVRLDQVVKHRSRDATFDQACQEAEQLTSVCIRQVGDPRRDAHIAALKAGNDIADLQSDAGLFNVLREMRLIPTRVAADLPGFEKTTFSDEGQLHALLDRYVDDPFARQALAAPMRESVVEHDTYDGLVGRILTAFGTGANDHMAGVA